MNAPESSNSVARRGVLGSIQVTRATPIREVIRVIDRSGRLSLALLVDTQGKFEATLTDGDVRRAIMAGIDLEAPAAEMLPLKAKLPDPGPVTAPATLSTSEQIALMQARHVRQLPLLDEHGSVVDVVLLQDLLPQAPDALRALIMAGGRGVRLRPLTDDVPKPMLPVGGRPLMERIVEQLHDSGIDRIVVSTHYKPEKIVDHFGDGSSFAVDMTYVQEDEPLGTGGALGLLPPSDEPILVINGDILTKVDFRALHRYHLEHAADMTIGVRQFGFEVPYGVVKTDGSRVLRIDEKPRLSLFVNAGIYLVEPSVQGFFQRGVSLSMPDLIERIIQAGLNVVSFPVMEYWLDIGRMDDYNSAQSEVETWLEGVSSDRRSGHSSS